MAAETPTIVLVHGAWADATGFDQVQALVYLNGWMCDEGESQQQLLERFEGSLVGPSIRPVPFTGPEGSEGTDLYLDPRRSAKPSPPTSTPKRPR
jgi:hypothetical protein